MNKFLKLNLQHFAENDAGGGQGTATQPTRIQEIDQRMQEIRGMLDDSEKRGNNKFTDLENEVRELKEEKQELEARQRMRTEARDMEQDQTEYRTVETFNTEQGNEQRGQSDEVNWEQRGTELYENRSVKVSSGDLVIPQHDSSNIKGTFNQVSSLIDRVNLVPLDGGESYETPYDIKFDEGNYTKEGEPYFDVDIEFGYAKINKTKVTAYNEITEEVLKIPRANYGQRVVEAVRQSLRKKITKEILNGRGPSEDEFVGIFSSDAKAINPDTDVEIDKIDKDTLENIIYGFGGDEDVEGEFTLILSKDDLRQFSKVRYEDGRKVYDIKHNGNTGTIDGVSYIINSGAGSLATANDGDYLMAYGPLSNYEMAVFSPTDVRRSEDYKFKEGMIAHRGSVFSGGNVVAFNGFLRVKKNAPEE